MNVSPTDDSDHSKRSSSVAALSDEFLTRSLLGTEGHITNCSLPFKLWTAASEEPFGLRQRAPVARSVVQTSQQNNP